MSSFTENSIQSQHFCVKELKLVDIHSKVHRTLVQNQSDHSKMYQDNLAHSPQALKHSCKNWTLALSATTNNTHFLSYIWEMFPIFFSEMSIELAIAPGTKQEMN